MLNIFKKLYEKSPRPVRSVFELVPQPFMFRREYYFALNDVETQKNSCVHIIRPIRDQRLSLVLLHAATHVPYYIEYFSGNNIKKCIKENPMEALSRFPIVDKNFISCNKNLFISDNFSDREKFLATTGGSTGEPFQIYLNNFMWVKEWGYIFGMLAKYGITPSSRRVSFRGVRRIGDIKRPYEYNPIYRELRISPFHLSNLYLDEILNQINQYKPEYIHGYYSAINEFLKLVGDDFAKLFPFVKLILLVSENVNSADMDNMTSVTGCAVTSFYGHSERACFAPWEMSEEKWIPNYLYGVSEVHNEMLVCTGLNNLAMPFIRYNTEDSVATRSGSNYIDFGDGFSEINGRWSHDFLYGKGGQRITMTALNTHIEEMKYVRKMQFVQNYPGEAVLNLLMLPCENQLYLSERIKNEFIEKTGGELNITINIVNEILLSPIGKHKLIVNNVKI